MAFCELARLRPRRAGPQREKRANVFERYTEKARRVIFFARYEASQYGSPYIETEHLLLGLMREDKALANRFLRQQGSIESIRKEIEGRITIRERISTSEEVRWVKKEGRSGGRKLLRRRNSAGTARKRLRKARWILSSGAKTKSSASFKFCAAAPRTIRF